jgi:hypothetical protein
VLEETTSDCECKETWQESSKYYLPRFAHTRLEDSFRKRSSREKSQDGGAGRAQDRLQQ